MLMMGHEKQGRTITWHNAHRGNGFLQLEQLVIQGLEALLLAGLTAVADCPPPPPPPPPPPLRAFLGFVVGDDVTGLEQKLQIK